MARWSVLAIAFFVACSSSRPATVDPPVDPVTEPAIVSAVEEAVIQGSVEGEEAARVGRRVGRVAGVLAAVLGGPRTESVDDMIDRYRMTRDAAIVTATVIGATHGAVEGAKRGYELDVQFAELTQIPRLDATRPFPDLIEVRFSDFDVLPEIAAVLAGREERAIEVHAAGNAALDVRDALIELGVTPASVRATRNDEISGAMLRIGYR
ncbi:MAG TPA: hypothetical protein VF432_12765 [Thermoanaerobaculia bacterium]